MVTLLGFFFILGNVLLLVIFMPDLVGPVWTFLRTSTGRDEYGFQAMLKSWTRVRVGCTIALLSDCGCE